MTACCRWLGARDDVPELLAMADLFVYPTLYREGLPRVLVEAALLARPIVCTDVVGCREAVRHEETGLLVPGKNPTALADACLRLLRDRGLANRLAQAARKRAIAEFELTVIAGHHRRLYHRLLEEARSLG